MPTTPLPPNPELNALKDQRVDLAVQISVLSDKGPVDSTPYPSCAVEVTSRSHTNSRRKTMPPR
jgi:hypothetical protein